MNFRAIVLRAPGTNCDLETQVALERAGAKVERVHVNRLAAEPAKLSTAQLLVLPGGFTFGDDVASGAVLAYTLKQRLGDSLARFVEDGRWVLGICNGFQALVRLNVLPDAPARAALTRNLSHRFEGRWVRLRAGASPGPWFEPGREIELPVAHAEGRFEYFGACGRTEPFPPECIALTFVSAAGSPAPYPDNPNGSQQDIAGITNRRGNVLGLMPHPERFLSPQNYPAWTRFRRAGRAPGERDLPCPLGLELFRRIVRA